MTTTTTPQACPPLPAAADPRPALEADLYRAAEALLEHVARMPPSGADIRAALARHVRGELEEAIRQIDRGEPIDPRPGVLTRAALMHAFDRVSARMPAADGQP